MLNKKVIECDLCVVGGGMAGMGAAISAAREGAKVVLMHERPVLGGNASSEIRMWVCGAKGDNNRETGIAEEIALENLYRNPTKSYAIWDTVLYDFVRREENITMLLNCPCMDAETEEGKFAHGRTRKIKSVTGYQMTTQTFFEVRAKYFCDSSGDSILAPLCQAEFRIGRESAAEFGEDSKLTEHDNTTMGMSCLLQGRETHEDIEFIAPPFAAKLTEKDFADRAPAPDVYSDYENFWYLELGGTRNTIDDTEVLRDELVGLAAGIWDYIKNSGKYDASKWDLDFLGFLPGKRESRRMSGEYTLTQKDVYGGGTFSDEIAYGGWPLDDHFPGGFYQKGEPNSFTDTPAPYSIPYRTLYSINVDNLYFAGRNISATHLAMSTTRVMATCMLLGEAVGKAAAIAAENGISPHDVYLEKMDLLQEKLLNGDCFLPSKLRKISEICQSAELSGACDIIRNGKDRGHALYGNEDSFACPVALNTEVSYSFAAAEVQSVHLVFSSDLNRDTLPGGHCERIHSTRANRRLDSPQMHMPTTLCREFKLIGELDGEKTELLHVCDNRKRSYHLPLDKKFDKLTLIPIKSWGTEDKVSVISFDFN